MPKPLRRGPMITCFGIGLCLGLSCGGAEPETGDAEAVLIELHEQVLAAHRRGDVDAWMALEGDDYVSANNGVVTFPSADERRSQRTPYLESTTFTTYRDLVTPVVRVSGDGTLGWVIAQVQVQGTWQTGTGPVEIDAVWAWIELYAREAGDWRLVGNVSNRRPDEAAAP